MAARASRTCSRSGAGACLIGCVISIILSRAQLAGQAELAFDRAVSSYAARTNNRYRWKRGRSTKLPHGEGWQYEPTWVRFRLASPGATANGSTCWGLSGRACALFPEIVAALAKLEPAVRARLRARSSRQAPRSPSSAADLLQSAAAASALSAKRPGADCLLLQRHTAPTFATHSCANGRMARERFFATLVKKKEDAPAPVARHRKRADSSRGWRALGGRRAGGVVAKRLDELSWSGEAAMLKIKCCAAPTAWWLLFRYRHAKRFGRIAAARSLQRVKAARSRGLHLRDRR